MQQLVSSCLGWHHALQLPALKALAAALSEPHSSSRCSPAASL